MVNLPKDSANDIPLDGFKIESDIERYSRERREFSERKRQADIEWIRVNS